MAEETAPTRYIAMVYVEDVGRSRDFYRDVVGLSPLVDYGGYAEFTWGALVLGLRQRDNAARQFGGAVAPAGTGASHQFTVVVDDVDDRFARIVARGAEPVQAPADQEWGMRSAAFRDPDGHVWELCQPIG